MRKNPYPGIFVELEGIDGSGKSTAAAGLKTVLEQLGFPVVLTKEPTVESPFGILVRKIYMQTMAPKVLSQMIRATLAEAALVTGELRRDEQKKYLKLPTAIADELEREDARNISLLIQLCMIFDRMYHLGWIIPKLGEGFIVIADRYFLSTLAYGRGDKLDWRHLLRIQDILFNALFIVPDLVLFIDVPPRVGLERMIEKQRRFGTIKELGRINTAYRDILKNLKRKKVLRVASVDGTLLPSAVVEKTLEETKKIIRLKRFSPSLVFETR